MARETLYTKPLKRGTADDVEIGSLMEKVKNDVVTKKERDDKKGRPTLFVSVESTCGNRR